MNVQQLIRKIHIYSGFALFLPLFLFAASGFMLNHRWKPWDNFQERTEIEKEVQVSIPVNGSGLDRAKAILESLKFDGEINILTYEPEKDRIVIRTHRPGQFSEVSLSLATGKGMQKITNLNIWSIFNNMHTFTGLHSNIPEKKNWMWTKVWSLIMDATAFAMIILLATGFYMWNGLKSDRRWGLLILELSSVIIILIIWIVSRF